MKEINYQFRQRFSVVHQPNRRDMDKKCPKGLVEVDGKWCIDENNPCLASNDLGTLNSVLKVEAK